MQLRDYQQATKADIYAAWADGAQNVCAVLPTGAGKTHTFSNIIRETPGVRFAIAHRQELISQMSLSLAEWGIMHSVQAQGPQVRYIAHLHTVKTGRPWIDQQAPVIVVGVKTLVNRAQTLSNAISKGTLWVQDECFPSGTMVGDRPIESLKVGDKVPSFNHETGDFETQAVTHVFKNIIPENMMRLDISGHHVLRCTCDHPFWTKRGWVNSKDLRRDDDLLLHRMWERDRGNKRKSKISISKRWSNLLRKIMRVHLPNETRKKTKTAGKNSTLLRMRKTVCSVWVSVDSMEERRALILLKKMLRCVPFSGFIRNHGENESKTCLGENEEKQSDAPCRNSEKSVKNITGNRPCPKESWWKRATSNESRKHVINIISWGRVFTAMHCPNWSLHDRWVGVSAALQDRLRKSHFQNRNRGGWVKSWLTGETGAGSKKRRVSEWKRVENVSIYKSGNTDQTGQDSTDRYVYNIEVSKTNTYLANGFVVHNCHHLLRANTWGKAAALFPDSCKGLGVTATPMRADGKGLGRHADGVFDALVVGPNMRELINREYLTDYRIFAPPSSFNTDHLKRGSTGDFTAPSLKAESKRSQIMGDVVDHYLRIAPGKLGVTFVTDVETATETSARLNAAGVPAEVLHAKTPDRTRQEINARMARGDIKQIVNVDILGEGYDCPAIEVCSMARPTESYGLFVQQFGRALRTMDGKTHAIIIDHVGNVMRHAARHGLPDNPPEWTLDRRERRSSGGDTDAIPLRVCLGCTGVYERFLKVCPYCGLTYEPAGRQSPEQVDGDLTELDPAVLAALRGEVARIDAPASDVSARMAAAGAPDGAVLGAAAQHRRRQEAQAALRHTVAVWAGWQRQYGRPDDESYRRFYLTFGVDVESAKALGKRQAEELNQRVLADLPN